MRTSLHFTFSSGILSFSSDARSMAEMSVQDEGVGGRGRREDSPQRLPSVPSRKNAHTHTPTCFSLRHTDSPVRKQALRVAIV